MREFSGKAHNLHSVRAKNIQCEFYFKTQYWMNAGLMCCSNSRRIIMPMYIHPVYVVQEPMIEVPQEWRPQEHQPVEMEYETLHELSDNENYRKSLSEKYSYYPISK
jgi:hypothetical protein